MANRWRSAAVAARNRTSVLAVAKLRTAALAHGAHVRMSIDPASFISPGIRVVLSGPGTIAVRVDAGARIEGDVLLQMSPGASLHVGPDVIIRRGSVLNVSGRLHFVGSNLLSWRSVVHCADEVTFDFLAGTGEMVTVVDGAHFRRDPEDHWYHNSATAPVHIGRNAWLASKATVGRGVRVGAGATVVANSVVTANVPANCMVAGIPAEIIKHDINRDRR